MGVELRLPARSTLVQMPFGARSVTGRIKVLTSVHPAGHPIARDFEGDVNLFPIHPEVRQPRWRDAILKSKHTKTRFTRMAEATARGAGRPATFVAALAIIVIWAVSGPLFGYSDTWQLVINTGTTIVTFLMVFLIQNTQNRDSQAVQMKLDELIRSHHGAHNSLLDLEELEVEDLDKLRQEYEALAKKARETLGDKEEQEEDEDEQDKKSKSKSKPQKKKRDEAA